MEATPIGGLEDFSRAARQRSIDPDSYSLAGEHSDGRYVLGRTAHGWTVYYSEHGAAKGTESFATQSEALTFLLRVLLGDPTTRLARRLVGTVTVLSALGRLLLTPQRHQMLRTAEDFAASRLTPIDAPGVDLATAVRELLEVPPIEPKRLLPGSPEARRAQARHRTGLMRAFGVARTADWITDARCVSVSEVDSWLTFTPSSHSRPSQELFAWRGADYTITAAMAEPSSNIADALREALDWCN